jgi:hypothetical protein
LNTTSLFRRGAISAAAAAVCASTTIIINNSILFDELIFYSSSALKNLFVLDQHQPAVASPSNKDVLLLHAMYQGKLMHLVPFQAIDLGLGVTWHLHNPGVNGC